MNFVERVRMRLLDCAEPMREAAFLLIASLADQGVSLRVVRTRASIEEQEALWLQGRYSLYQVNLARKRVGWAPITEEQNERIVTKAQPGYSWHNFGRAIDVVPVDVAEAGDLSDPDNPLWENPWWDAIGRVGEELGFEWGGRWERPDRPHFQWTHGTTLAQLRLTEGFHHS